MILDTERRSSLIGSRVLFFSLSSWLLPRIAEITAISAYQNSKHHVHHERNTERALSENKIVAPRDVGINSVISNPPIRRVSLFVD